ncbi:hypothetical protein MACH17_33070 [Phaeobacter inhibens]|nr:hypothetical protein MACH17_33070 [Phaeobacter inhibens]
MNLAGFIAQHDIDMSQDFTRGCDDAGFFKQFTGGSLHRSFAQFNMAAGETPPACIRGRSALDEDHPIAALAGLADHGESAKDRAQGLIETTGAIRGGCFVGHGWIRSG